LTSLLVLILFIMYILFFIYKNFINILFVFLMEKKKESSDDLSDIRKVSDAVNFSPTLDTTVTSKPRFYMEGQRYINANEESDKVICSCKCGKCTII